MTSIQDNLFKHCCKALKPIQKIIDVYYWVWLKKRKIKKEFILALGWTHLKEFSEQPKPDDGDETLAQGDAVQRLLVLRVQGWPQQAEGHQGEDVEHEQAQNTHPQQWLACKRKQKCIF